MIKEIEIKATPVIVIGSTSTGSLGQEQLKATANKLAEPAVMARYNKKDEEPKFPALKEGEKKKIRKHELKVPKVGQLDAVKASRIRQLSSNQLAGFKIRSGLASSEFDGTNKEMYKTYGMGQQEKEQVDTNYFPGSNQDLVDFLNQKNKSSMNFFNDGDEGQREDELNVDNSEDQEEVGTQMMISRGNLTTSPKATFAILDKVSKYHMLDSDRASVALNPAEEADQLSKMSLSKKTFDGYTTQTSKQMLNRKINSSHTINS
jgi:hypothetical protein